MHNGIRHFKWQGANSGFQKNLRNSTLASLPKLNHIHYKIRTQNTTAMTF